MRRCNRCRLPTAVRTGRRWTCAACGHQFTCQHPRTRARNHHGPLPRVPKGKFLRVVTCFECDEEISRQLHTEEFE